MTPRSSNAEKHTPHVVCVFSKRKILTRSMLLFPSPSPLLSLQGGAAILFSNRARDRPRAKYALVHAERVHSGADDGAYGCMAWQPDADGVNGV